jgi:ParB family chromosome partitioning protein
MNVFHSSESDSWGTPGAYIEAARKVLGRIDLDPASSAHWNQTVGATRFYDMHDFALEQDWRGSVFMNPPGGKDGNKSVSGEFWRKLMRERHAGHIAHAIVVAFNLNALQQTQDTMLPSMCEFPFCVPGSRVKYVKATGKAESPPHASAFVYVPGNLDETVKFRNVFSRFGAICNGGI